MIDSFKMLISPSQCFQTFLDAKNNLLRERNRYIMIETIIINIWVNIIDDLHDHIHAIRSLDINWF